MGFIGFFDDGSDLIYLPSFGKDLFVDTGLKDAEEWSAESSIAQFNN